MGSNLSFFLSLSFSLSLFHSLSLSLSLDLYLATVPLIASPAGGGVRGGRKGLVIRKNVE